MRLRDSVPRVFSVFLFLARKSRRTKVFLLLSLLPASVSLVFRLEQVFRGAGSGQGIPLFSNIIMLFNLQFLILILALFYGTSICMEDVENKTLPYLTTRPLSKPAIVLGKYLAYTLTAVVMMALGMIMSFLILNSGRLLNIAVYKVLWRDLGVLTLGLITYTAFFTFLGSFVKRSVFFGLLFCFGWENVIQYFPGSTQRLAIAHYLKSLLPYSSGRFSILTFRLEPTRLELALLALGVMTVVFLGLACLFFLYKERILED